MLSNLMAANLIFHRAAVHAKSSYAFLHILNRQQRYFSDDSKKKTNLYETLGIPSSATQGEIKKAYYDLTLKFHPDKNINNEEAALKFREISEAYEILGNYRSRKRYDRGLPVSDVKKIIKHAVDHKAQYQEFFDSRSAKHSSTHTDARMKEMHDLGTYSTKKDPEKEMNEAARLGSSPMIQLVLWMFILLVVYFSR